MDEGRDYLTSHCGAYLQISTCWNEGTSSNLLLFCGLTLSKGSYTDTFGLGIIREDVAQFISRGDGYTADPDDVILTNGGALGMQVCETDLVRV